MVLQTLDVPDFVGTKVSSITFFHLPDFSGYKLCLPGNVFVWNPLLLDHLPKITKTPWSTLDYVKVGAITTTAVTTVGLLVPAALGFGGVGVAAKSVAAWYQSAYLGGFIAKGSAFAVLQHYGATTCISGLVLKAGVAGIGGGAIGAAAAQLRTQPNGSDFSPNGPGSSDRGGNTPFCGDDSPLCDQNNASIIKDKPVIADDKSVLHAVGSHIRRAGSYIRAVPYVEEAGSYLGKARTYVWHGGNTLWESGVAFWKGSSSNEDTIDSVKTVLRFVEILRIFNYDKIIHGQSLHIDQLEQFTDKEHQDLVNLL